MIKTIERITFTGVDKWTDWNRLLQINKEYNDINIEWAFLFSPTNKKNRYWNEWDVDNIISHRIVDSPLFAAHLCGDYAHHFFLGHSIDKFAQFRRLQLNFNYKYNQWNEQDLLNNLKYYKDNKFILQYNNSSKEFVSKYKDIPNVNILFDASGGRGSKPREWPKPLDNLHECSYAGGLGPDNLNDELNKINSAVLGSFEGIADDGQFGVDIESNIRTDDRFDLDKCVKCLEIIRNKK